MFDQCWVNPIEATLVHEGAASASGAALGSVDSWAGEAGERAGAAGAVTS